MAASTPPASSVNRVTSPPISPRSPPKTAPPTKAAMNPLPESDGKCVCQRGPGDRHDLEPIPVDQAARDALRHHDRGGESGDHAADHAETDLLQDELDGGPAPDRSLLGLGDRDRDEQQRDTDAVIEPAFDIETLADT